MAKSCFGRSCNASAESSFGTDSIPKPIDRKNGALRKSKILNLEHVSEFFLLQCEFAALTAGQMQKGFCSQSMAKWKAMVVP